jgi:hypothetical protein
MEQQPSVVMEPTASAKVAAGPVHIMEVSQSGFESAYEKNRRRFPGAQVGHQLRTIGRRCLMADKSDSSLGV